MDYNKIIDEIIEKLRSSNSNEFAMRIEKARDFSFTSTELLLKVGFELKRMYEEDSESFFKVKDLAEKYFAFCESIGLNLK